MSKLLIEEYPLQVLPSLAVKIGLNEAIILQQFHYWLQRSKNIKDGRKWIYNSVVQWNEQFPFWSNSTLKRAIKSLKKQGLIITDNYNKAGFDKTRWYSIDYEKLDKLGNEPMTQRLGQNDPTSGSKRPNGLTQNDPTNTKRLPENTQESSSSSDEPTSSKDEQVKSDEQEVIKYINDTIQSNDFERSKDLRARLKEGYTVNQLKQVTYYCAHTDNWLNKDGMFKYIRPTTLFRKSNCEKYYKEAKRMLKHSSKRKNAAEPKPLTDEEMYS